MNIPRIRGTARDATTLTFDCQETLHGKQCSHLTVQRAAPDSVYVSLTRDATPESEPFRKSWLVRHLPISAEPKTMLTVTPNAETNSIRIDYRKDHDDPQQRKGRFTIDYSGGAASRLNYRRGASLRDGMQSFAQAIANFGRCVEHGVGCARDFYIEHARDHSVAEFRSKKDGEAYTLETMARDDALSAAKEYPRLRDAYRDAATRFEKTPNICKMTNARMAHELKVFWKSFGVTQDLKAIRAKCVKQFTPHRITTTAWDASVRAALTTP